MKLNQIKSNQIRPDAIKFNQIKILINDIPEGSRIEHTERSNDHKGMDEQSLEFPEHFSK